MFKILIYTHEYPPFRGGAGVYSFDLAHGLASIGTEVHVATTLTESSIRASASFDSDSSNVHLHYLDNWQNSVTLARNFILRLHLLNSFDIIVVTERIAQEVVSKIRYPFFRYASVVHGSEILHYFGRNTNIPDVAQSRMLRFYKNSLVNIAVSKATCILAQRLLKNDDVPLAVVQNGVNIRRLQDVDSLRVQEVRNKFPANTEFVFSLGRLDLDKGHEILILAFKQVLRQRPSARLLIGGDGPYRNRLVELCCSLELEDSVCFLGNVSDADLPTYYGLCDVFAMPSKSESRWEGFGLVFLEANYYEKPVIGGGEGGVVEAIANGETGYLVDPRNASDVAEAIEKLLHDKTLQTKLGRSGRQRVLGYFNSQRMAKETLGVLMDNLTQKGETGRLKRCCSLVFYSIAYSLYAMEEIVRNMLKTLLTTRHRNGP